MSQITLALPLDWEKYQHATGNFIEKLQTTLQLGLTLVAAKNPESRVGNRRIWQSVACEYDDKWMKE